MLTDKLESDVWMREGATRASRRIIPGGYVANDSVLRLRQNIQTAFLGHSSALDLLIIGLLGRGHVLIEDVLGVGKTVLAKSLAKSIACISTRLQLTPDLLLGGGL